MVTLVDDVGWPMETIGVVVPAALVVPFSA
jgi:hypothetical protein